MKSKELDEIRAGLLRKRTGNMTIQSDLLSTGSTLLNLACTGNWKGGFAKGKYFFLVGDSASGKTFLSLTCLAEASVNSAFNDYRFVYDDVEGGALMSIERFFGKAVSQRLEPPELDGDLPIYSRTIEEFYWHLDDALTGGKPVIYILDSMDGLSSESESRKFQETKLAARKGKEVAGSYGDTKAKANSSGIRSCLSKLRDTGSILIVVNQTRDNVGAGLFESKKTRSGGHALTFYATLELWSSIAGKIKRTVKGQQRVVGVNCRVKVKKNRFTGKERTVDLPIYYSYGIDDVGSCIDFLTSEGRWEDKKGIIGTAKDFGDLGPMKRSKLIEYIEQQGLEQDLRDLVATVWQEVEEACDERRKPRY